MVVFLSLSTPAWSVTRWAFIGILSPTCQPQTKGAQVKTSKRNAHGVLAPSKQAQPGRQGVTPPPSSCRCATGGATEFAQHEATMAATL